MNRWNLGMGAVCAATMATLATAGVSGCGSSSSATTGAGAASSASHGSSTSGTMASSGSTGGSSASSTSTSGSGSTSVSTSTSSGAGGASPGDGGTCLAASSFAAAFSIMDSSFCAVAIYSSPEPLTNGATWGTHQGPLTMTADATGGGVTLERWTVPSGTSGALTKQTTHVTAGVPTGAYLNPLANDMPFFGWTMVSWTGPATDAGTSIGQIEAIANGAVAASYTVNGIYAVGGVAASGGLGRLLFTGLSPLGSPSTDTNGLYEADACSSPMNELGAGTGCSPSAVVSAYADYSGPLAVDKNGDVFTVLDDATTSMQVARGFLGADVARGAGPTAGSQLFQVGGYAGSLAAITPTASKPGVLVFQPTDSNSPYDALDVIEQLFTAGVVEAGTAVAPMGSTATMLHITTPSSAGVTLMTDESDRLWVGTSDTATTTQWIVLARTP